MRENTMTSTAPAPKALIRAVLEAQPEDATYEEILREMAFDRMVEKGLADVRAGRTISDRELERRVEQWRK